MNRTVNYAKGFGQERIEKIANEIVRRTKARKDYVAPRGKLGVTITDGANPTLALTIQNGREHVLPFSTPALGQVLGSLDFPKKFADRLTDRGHLDLVAATLSELLVREASTDKGERKHLIRELDGQVDGFLSDKFKSISHDSVLAIVLEEAHKAGAEVWDFKLTSTIFNIDLIAPGVRGRVEHAMKSDAPGHGWARNLGDDWLNAAVKIGNSENGHGRFFGDISVWREACSNFAVVQKGVSRVHLGAKLEEGDQLIVSDETRELEDKALVSKLRDVISCSFDRDRFKRLLDSVSATTARTLGEASATEVVDATIKTFGLPQERKEAILETFLKGPSKSQYFAAQALTAQANPQNASDLDDETRTAFEQAGGTILAMGERDWKRFLANAITPKEETEEKATQTVARVR